LFDSLDEIENFPNSLEGEILALNGNEDFFCRHEGVGHEKSNAWRAVEDDQIERGIEAEGVEGVSDVSEWIFHSSEIHLRSRKVELGSENL
jgi:hypothetical protein